MPVVEGGHNDEVPPVVRVPHKVHLAGEPTLRYFGGIEHKGHQAEQIHDHNPWHHQSNQLVLESAHGHRPVPQWQDAIRRPEEQHSHLAIHRDIQLRYLHSNGQAEHAQRNGRVQSAQKLKRKKKELVNVFKKTDGYCYYRVTPEGIVHAAYIDGHQRQGDAQKINRQEELVVLFRLAGEDVIYGRHQHAQAEAHEQTDHQHLILQLRMLPQKLKVEDGQPNEEYAAGQMTPDIDL